MSLKIKYLDKTDISSKNIGIFTSKDIKTTDFSGIFDKSTIKKVFKYLAAKKSEKSKIYCQMKIMTKNFISFYQK